MDTPPASPLGPSRYFPRAEEADEHGALCVGGSLDSELLIDAYSHGIFPWPTDDDDPLIWWSPDPRAIFQADSFRPSRRALRRLRSGQLVGSIDTDFAGVIRGCATGPGRQGETWITPNMIRAYTRLHHARVAHSVEVRRDGQLVGGVYGVAIGGLFAAESMFHRHRDASTVALAILLAHTQARGYRLLDIQQWTSHTGHLGAIEVSRNEYLRRLAEVVDLPVTFGTQLAGDPLSFRSDL